LRAAYTELIALGPGRRTRIGKNFLRRQEEARILLKAVLSTMVQQAWRRPGAERSPAPAWQGIEPMADIPVHPAAPKSESGSFADLLRRIRCGDGQAAVELVRQYESAIRLEVRMRLRSARLRRVLDSMDICQSVLASFFVRAAAGHYDLEEPGQLIRLLT